MPLRRILLSPGVAGRAGLAILAAGLACALAAPRAAGDEVTTRDGKTYEGKVVEEDGSKVVIETTFDGSKEFLRSDVKSVDKSTPPLREQLSYRLEKAKGDAAALTDLLAWAKSKGFGKELQDLWKALVEADPKNVKAHQALGHVKVGDAWMTPEEKAAADKKAEEDALRAKGLVPYLGKWVTPQEKEALQKGLVKDGEEWVTEDEFHKRRGEVKVGGVWARLGEKEGKERAEALSKALSLTLEYLWGAHVDVIHELTPEQGKSVLDATEKVAVAFHALLKPGPQDGLDGRRVTVACFQKSAAYARYALKFAEENAITKMPGFEEWPRQAKMMPSFWWTDPACTTAHYLFPNTAKALVSSTSHNLSHILLNRYRFNFRFSSAWFTEGLAYELEQQANGYSTTYTVGRAKGAGAGSDLSVWMDSKKWKETLKATAAAGQDTPIPRLVGFKATDLSVSDLVKSWSVVDLLVKIDPAKFKAYVDGVKKGRDAPEEAALKEAYGTTWVELERRWKAWVAGGYGAP